MNVGSFSVMGSGTGETGSVVFVSSELLGDLSSSGSVVFELSEATLSNFRFFVIISGSSSLVSTRLPARGLGAIPLNRLETRFKSSVRERLFVVSSNVVSLNARFLWDTRSEVFEGAEWGRRIGS